MCVHLNTHKYFTHFFVFFLQLNILFKRYRLPFDSLLWSFMIFCVHFLNAVLLSVFWWRWWWAVWYLRDVRSFESKMIMMMSCCVMIMLNKICHVYVFVGRTFASSLNMIMHYEVEYKDLSPMQFILPWIYAILFVNTNFKFFALPLTLAFTSSCMSMQANEDTLHIYPWLSYYKFNVVFGFVIAICTRKCIYAKN